MSELQFTAEERRVIVNRLNREERAHHTDADDDDPEYRAKVKKRMLEGLTSAQLPPLIKV